MSKSFSNIKFFEVSYGLSALLYSSAVKFYCRRLLEFKCSCFCLFFSFFAIQQFFSLFTSSSSPSQPTLPIASIYHESAEQPYSVVELSVFRFSPVIFKWKTLCLTTHELFCHLALIY